jgi:ABC-type dipeptide/oligopeptide/nickel transport system permease subunit
MMFFPWKRALRSKSLWFSVVIMLALGSVAALAPRIAPHDPYEVGIRQTRLPPMWVHGKTISGLEQYPLGTDRYGRDILSRMLYATRTAFFLAFSAVPLAALFGTLIGLVAGQAGGRLDSWIMLFIDMINSLPGIMFVVIIVLIFRSILTPTWSNGLLTLIVGFAAISWVNLARLIRVNVLQIKSQAFVEAAVALGASRRRVILQHLLPNVFHVILIWIINNIPAVILLEAVLGYIGVGVTSATDGGEFSVISWGGIFFSGRSALTSNPLMLIIPSICILLISMSFILLGDFLASAYRRE